MGKNRLYPDFFLPLQATTSVPNPLQHRQYINAGGGEAPHQCVPTDEQCKP